MTFWKILLRYLCSPNYEFEPTDTQKDKSILIDWLVRRVGHGKTGIYIAIYICSQPVAQNTNVVLYFFSAFRWDINDMREIVIVIKIHVGIQQKYHKKDPAARPSIYINYICTSIYVGTYIYIHWISWYRSGGRVVGINVATWHQPIIALGIRLISPTLLHSLSNSSNSLFRRFKHQQCRSQTWYPTLPFAMRVSTMAAHKFHMPDRTRPLGRIPAPPPQVSASPVKFPVSCILDIVTPWAEHGKPRDNWPRFVIYISLWQL